MSDEAPIRLRALFLSAALVFSVFGGLTTLSGVAVAGNASTLAGSGTAEDPYVITDAGELQSVDADLDAHYVLGNDIDASATSEWNGGDGFEPIRGSDPVNNAGDRFTGTFDGRGHAISNLTVDRTGENYVGLFGFVGDGTITNVSLVDANVTGAFGGGTNPDIGALAGYSLGTTVSNASVSGAVNGTGATSTVGGLIGWSEETTIVDSSSSANVNAGGSDEVGGLVGYNLGYTDGSSVVNSRASGNVSGDTFVGGLLGYTEAYGGESEISNSTASADVTGVNSVGGLVGYDRGTPVIGSSAFGNVTGDDRVGGLVGRSINVDRIERSYAVGNVSAATNGGGLIGENDGAVQSSYWNVDHETTGIGGGTTGGATGLGTTEMTGESAGDYMTAFDFGGNWTTTDGYPRPRGSVTGLTATLGSTELDQGATTSATATLRLVGGTNVSATTVADYSSSDTAVATVNATGVVTAHAPGSATITVDHAGETNAVAVTTLDTTDPMAAAGSDRTVDAGASVTFDASNSTDNVGVASYEWDLDGDGTTDATGQAATHTYADPGTYTVTLTVTDAAGNAGSDTRTIEVDDGGGGGGGLGSADGGGGNAGGAEPAGQTNDDGDGQVTRVSAAPGEGGTATATTSVDGGETVRVELGDSSEVDAETALSQVEITVEGDIEGGILTFEAQSLEAPPPNADAPEVGDGGSNAGDDALAYFELRASIAGEDASDQIASATVRFTVEEARLPERGLDRDDVALYRFDEGVGAWEELDFTFVEERDERLVYEATTPGFSLFAVGVRSAGGSEPVTTTAKGESIDTPMPAETTTPSGDARAARSTEAESPGFGVAVAIVALSAVVVLARRRTG